MTGLPRKFTLSLHGDHTRRLRAVLIGRQSQLEAAVRGEPRALLRRVGLNLNLHAAMSSHL
jgi:hypothetical protein